MEIKRKGTPNDCIKCEVNTCYYYAEGDKCAAQQIKVAPRNAQNSGETDCITFQPNGLH